MTDIAATDFTIPGYQVVQVHKHIREFIAEAEQHRAKGITNVAAVIAASNAITAATQRLLTLRVLGLPLPDGIDVDTLA